jgi:hypothetical protein
MHIEGSKSHLEAVEVSNIFEHEDNDGEAYMLWSKRCDTHLPSNSSTVNRQRNIEETPPNTWSEWN